MSSSKNSDAYLLNYFIFSEVSWLLLVFRMTHHSYVFHTIQLFLWHHLANIPHSSKCKDLLVLNTMIFRKNSIYESGTFRKKTIYPLDCDEETDRHPISIEHFLRPLWKTYRTTLEFYWNDVKGNHKQTYPSLNTKSPCPF